MHSEEWMRRNIVYMSDCQKHKRFSSLLLTSLSYATAESFKMLPQAQWFISAYARDVWSRLDVCRADITSVFGEILKIDSTKKILKKLAGVSRGTATWVTNVGNEYGAILQCVLTSSESNDGLETMAEGLMQRYKDANVPPPVVLYTDNKCCSQEGDSKYKKLFWKWENLEVRLDIWHFMRRIALGCTTESHPLYGPFMAKLSAAIFEWDKNDYQELLAAKGEELVKKGLKNATKDAAAKAIKKSELARHCRRRTRGIDSTIKSIEELILAYTGCTDTLGVPLFKEEDQSMVTVYKEQIKHIGCIQDPDVSLYTQIGTSKKGNRTLPIFRCARGSTSLESFHSHLPTFIPGKSANETNFQAYLIDGLSRWNKSRKDAAMSSDLGSLRSFDSELMAKFNSLHLDVHGCTFNNIVPPNTPGIKEYIGVEYLFQELNLAFTDVDKKVEENVDSDNEGDEGFEEEEYADISTSEVNVEEEEENEEVEVENYTDGKGIPGWDKIDALARELLNGTGIALSDIQAEKILKLYDGLEEFDKRPLLFKQVTKEPTSGRFGSRKRSGFQTLVKMKRMFMSGSSSALSPTKSRLVEAICVRLCLKITGVGSDRWKRIINEYQKVCARVLNNTVLVQSNKLVLFKINETTLRNWLKEKDRQEEILMLMQGREVPPNLNIASDPLPLTRPPATNLHGDRLTLSFPEPEDREGKAVFKRPRQQQMKRPSSQIAESQPPKKIISQPFPGFLSPPSSPSFSITNPHFHLLPTTSPNSFSQFTHRPPEQQSVSKSTFYRQLKDGKDPSYARRKPRCRKCGKEISDGHRRYRSYIYCPHEPGAMTYEKWVQEKKKELEK